MNSFASKVLRVVSRIPAGKTRTYKEVARAAGNENAARAVGSILHSYDSKKIKVPCHRVVRSDGGMGGYRWGVGKKKQLLKKEGAMR